STIQVAFALSLALHVLVLWNWGLNPSLKPFEDPMQGKPNGALAVRMAPPPASASPAQPAHTVPSPGAAARRLAAAPRVLALDRPSPSPSAPARPVESPQPPAVGDFASFVEARRRARAPAPAAPSKPVESEQERDNRLAAARLGLDQAPTFGADLDHGGGIFQVERVGFNDAEFFFYGWNKNIRRLSRQMISVRRGDNPSIELAIVRKMIAIIREHTSVDFSWNSRRLGRAVMLSARVNDNAGLEDFLMQEFFANPRPASRPG
ncbi:MAG: hypothetical protein ABI654_03070, partial [Betaproteobacteria bacterium]